MTRRKTEPKPERGASRTLHSVAKPGETREQLIAQIAAA